MDMHAITAQAVYDSALGPMRLARTAKGLAGAWFEGQKHDPGALDAPVDPGDPLLADAARAIARYLSGAQRSIDVPLDPQGTPFQRAVWSALREIPRGATTSYGAVAQRIGAPRASRAVGAAVGRNPVSVIVPCHRVLGRDGALTGYAGGLARKRALLALEST